ncbi:MAG: hypothetical protein ACRCU3_01250 [Eubacteriaceae bacterium]
MRKRIGLFFMMALIIFMTTSCIKKEEEKNQTGNIQLRAVIDEVTDNELIISTIDFQGFDVGRVNLEGFKLDFTPEVGQKIDLVILPQIGMSYPAFVNPIEIKLLTQGQ